MNCLDGFEMMLKVRSERAPRAHCTQNPRAMGRVFLHISTSRLRPNSEIGISHRVRKNLDMISGRRVGQLLPLRALTMRRAGHSKGTPRVLRISQISTKFQPKAFAHQKDQVQLRANPIVPSICNIRRGRGEGCAVQSNAQHQHTSTSTSPSPRNTATHIVLKLRHSKLSSSVSTFTNRPKNETQPAFPLHANWHLNEA